MFSGGIVISGGGTAIYNKIAMNVATYVHTVALTAQIKRRASVWHASIASYSHNSGNYKWRLLMIIRGQDRINGPS